MEDYFELFSLWGMGVDVTISPVGKVTILETLELGPEDLAHAHYLIRHRTRDIVRQFTAPSMEILQ